MILNAKKFWKWWTTELRSWMTERFRSVISNIPTVEQIQDGLTKEQQATLNKQEITTAISNLRGGTATVEQVKTIVSALINGLTQEDKDWLAEQFKGIDLSDITNRLDNSEYGLEALKQAIASIPTPVIPTDYAKEQTLNDQAQSIKDKIENIPTPVIPTDYAKEQTLTQQSAEIKTAIAKGGGNPSKTAYEAMKRLQPYLYSIEYSELDYEGARDYFATHFVPVQGSCTALRKGNQLGRNYDWKYNNEVEFLVRTKAHNGRFASIGIAGSISALTTATIGEYSEEFKWMPFRMLDGMNEKGLTANVNMLNHDEERSLPQDGTTPLIEEREAICSAMLVRYVLDNFATPQEACEYIRDYVRVYPPYSEGHTTDLHFALTNKEQLYYLCFEPDNNDVFRTMIADVKDQPLPFVMTNFRMWWAQRIFDDETGHYDRFANPDYDKVEKYAMGIERANLCLDFVQDTETSQSVLEFMREELAYTRSYFESTNPQWLTEFVGEYSEEDLARDSAATDFDRILGIVRQRYQERSRETALTWQTVHSVVYDLEAMTMQIVTQESGVDNVIEYDVVGKLPTTKEDLAPLAKEETVSNGFRNLDTIIREAVSSIKTWVTNKTNDILSAIRAIPEPDLSAVAKEATLTAGVSSIEQKIDAIPAPDLSQVAKQGNNPDVSLTSVNAKMDTVIGTGITEVSSQAIHEIVQRVINL